jgi:hypothetical protein
MIGLEILRDYGNGNFLIQPWEMILYVAVVSLYAFMGRVRSCLINSFAFTFYWGFMFLLPRTFAGNGFSHSALLAYVLFGAGMYALVTVSFLRQHRKRAPAVSAPQHGDFQ